MFNRLLFLAIVLPVAVYPQILKSSIDDVLKEKFFESCQVTIQIEDLTTNSTLYKKNEKLLLRPASNMKILTSAAALLFLGPDYEFTTDIYYDGYISSDTLYGDIYIVGGCDPDFVTQDLYYFVDALISQNISTITGNLYGDISFKDSLYWGKGWMWDDDPSSDAPYLSSLNINDNCVEVNYNGENDLIEIRPNTNYIDIKRIESDQNLIIDRNWFERKNEIIVKGENDINKYSTKVNVLRPENYFLKVFAEVLDSNNITISGYIGLQILPNSAKYLYSFKRKYSDLISNLNKTSDNLSAEMSLYALANKYCGKPATADSGIQLIYNMIDTIGLDYKNYRVVDGSGVSHYNLISAELLANLLKYFYMEKPELYKILYDSFPIAGIDGTLEFRMRNTMAENNVHAKTGTLSGVSTLAGYLTTKDNHMVAFSIMMQNYVGSSAKAKKWQDEICRILSELK